VRAICQVQRRRPEGKRLARRLLDMFMPLGSYLIPGEFSDRSQSPPHMSVYLAPFPVAQSL